VTSYVFRDGAIDYKRLEEMVKVIGKGALVLDLSCRKKDCDGGYFVVTDRWQKFTDFEITEENLIMLSKYCDEYLVHGVDVEGLRVGVMEDLVEKLGMWSPIPVTYAGGARSISDLELVKRLGRGNVDLTVGSALDIFGGDLPYDTVVKWHYANFDVLEDADKVVRMRVIAARAAVAAKNTLDEANRAFRLSLEM